MVVRRRHGHCRTVGIHVFGPKREQVVLTERTFGASIQRASEQVSGSFTEGLRPGRRRTRCWKLQYNRHQVVQ